MESIISTDCDSQTAPKYRKNSGALPDKAARLRHKSKTGLMVAKGAVATKKAESKPIAIETELSLLQSNFESALEAGLKAKIYPTKGIVVIELHGCGICGICHAWTAKKECPACGNNVEMAWAT